MEVSTRLGSIGKRITELGFVSPWLPDTTGKQDEGSVAGGGGGGDGGDGGGGGGGDGGGGDGGC